MKRVKNKTVLIRLIIQTFLASKLDTLYSYIYFGALNGYDNYSAGITNETSSYFLLILFSCDIHTAPFPTNYPPRTLKSTGELYCPPCPLTVMTRRIALPALFR